MSIKYTEEYLTTAQAAKELGLSTDSVKVYCNSTPQRLAGEKVGNGWMIPRSAIERYRKQHSSLGRPKKCQDDE